MRGSFVLAVSLTCYGCSSGPLDGLGIFPPPVPDASPVMPASTAVRDAGTPPTQHFEQAEAGDPGYQGPANPVLPPDAPPDPADDAAAPPTPPDAGDSAEAAVDAYMPPEHDAQAPEAEASGPPPAPPGAACSNGTRQQCGGAEPAAGTCPGPNPSSGYCQATGPSGCSLSGYEFPACDGTGNYPCALATISSAGNGCCFWWGC